jgi:hypothetical protein
MWGQSLPLYQTMLCSPLTGRCIADTNRRYIASTSCRCASRLVAVGGSHRFTHAMLLRALIRPYSTHGVAMLSCMHGCEAYTQVTLLPSGWKLGCDPAIARVHHDSPLAAGKIVMAAAEWNMQPHVPSLSAVDVVAWCHRKNPTLLLGFRRDDAVGPRGSRASNHDHKYCQWRFLVKPRKYP